ncbi:MAG TPA: hypothetical protein VHQ66_03255 [Myxococcota bacterium]|nr:hypothetical protein [Myxococcota bacterium]
MRRIGWLVATAALALAAPAWGESALLLPLPDAFGAIDAGTFDGEGHRVGAATMEVRRRADGRVEVRAESGIEGSAHSAVAALMELAPGGGALRLLSQRSESFDTSGASLGVLTIDHEARVARCGVPAGSDDEPVALELPPHDRIVNVPLNLLFQRLVRGEASEVAFQVLLCRFGARILDARARIATPRAEGGLVEVQYRLDFGPLLSSVAQPFLPTLSFWFDPDSPGAWVAHRMPLFSKGPTVLVVRSGFSPERLAPHVGAAPAGW